MNGRIVTNGLRVCVRACVLACVLGVLAGCWSFAPARRSASRAGAEETSITLAPDAWPARSLDAVRPLLENTPEQVHEFRYKAGVDAATLRPEIRELVERPYARVHYKGLHGQGLLRIFERDFASNDTKSWSRLIDEISRGFSPNASFVTSRTLEDVALLNDQARRRQERNVLGENSRWKEAGFEPTGLPDELVLEGGRALRFPAPMVGETYRGVVLHFTALAGNPYENKVVAEFTRRGWYVVDINTYTSVRPPVPEADLDKADALDTQRAALWKEIVGPDPEQLDMKAIRRHPRHAEYQRLGDEAARLRAGAFQICSDADIPSAARQIAEAVDSAMTSNAYAAEAALDYLRTQRPDIPRHPIIVVGFSAGAIAAPTAAARILDDVDAVVLVGGGVNVLRMSQASIFTDGGLKLRCGKEKISRDRLAALDRAYLEASRLDPYHTAPLLRGKRVLQVHGTRDTWVPARYGEMLYERLGRPDRLSIWGGHEFLFYFLPGQAERIADWMDRAGEEARGERAE